MTLNRRSFLSAGAALAVLPLLSARPASAAATELLNVSYDVARELYVAINAAFEPWYQATTGEEVVVSQSHGGSSRQARAVLEGLPADVVTFNQVIDVQALVQGGLVGADWQSRLPNNASPYYSLPAFLVRAGNPKGIRDWSDLVREDVEVVFPNPKTSGNARYTYLAAYAYALATLGEDPAQAEDFVKTLFSRVPVFDTGGRGATTTFVERETGDALITFEAEVHAIRREYGDERFDIVIPSRSLLAEFPVAVVDKGVEARGTRSQATAYLEFLYTPEGQTILAEFGNRVHEPGVVAAFAEQFPELILDTVEERFGGWERVQSEHFGEDGILNRVFTQG